MMTNEANIRREEQKKNQMDAHMRNQVKMHTHTHMNMNGHAYESG